MEVLGARRQGYRLAERGTLLLVDRIAMLMDMGENRFYCVCVC
jgi:hypothetical protein